MEEKLITSNILTLQKSLIEMLIHGTIESSNNNINNIFLNQLNNNLEMQTKIFKFMQEKAWYNIKNVEEYKIMETANKLKNS